MSEKIRVRYIYQKSVSKEFPCAAHVWYKGQYQYITLNQKDDTKQQIKKALTEEE